MRQKPTVLARQIVAKSRLFTVEEMQLRFANGEERTYERLANKGTGHGAVMVVALQDATHALLIEEYCGGVEDYELSLPKGLVEPGEEILDAANRELKTVDWQGGQRTYYEYLWEERRIWGVTAAILVNLARRLDGVRQAQ